MNANLLNKYLRNECTSQELEEVLHWFQQEADTPAGKKIMRESWEGFENPDGEATANFEQMLDRLHHQINLSATPLQVVSKNTAGRKMLKYLTRAAAILFLPMAALLILTYGGGALLFQAEIPTEWLEISTPAGAKTTFNLPDGSTVWLNHGSTLRYPQQFDADYREVEISGEAYFDVQSDPDHPFRVLSGELQVVALGTEFNVLAYPEDSTLEVTLISGRVDIMQSGRSGTRNLYQMQPDEHLVFQRQARKLTPSRITSDKYIAWKEGKLIFENDPFGEVIRRLSRWYHVEFELDDPTLANLTYKATFTSETLPQVLDLMELASPIAYEITPRTLQPDGSFSKMKVIVRRK